MSEDHCPLDWVSYCSLAIKTSYKISTSIKVIYPSQCNHHGVAYRVTNWLLTQYSLMR